ncbi:MAG: hypothetical protein JOZ65_20880 [Chloroflexi bacterium]|nr:hypothetical protein [Chloroflexota bacterium]
MGNRHRLAEGTTSGLRIHVQGVDPDQKGELIAGAYRGPLPISGLVAQRGRQCDVVGTYLSNVLAISSRFRQVLIESELTGWVTYELRIRRQSITEPLWLLGATGRTDESDFFVSDSANGICASAAAAAELRCARLSNLLLEPAGWAELKRKPP